MFRILLAGVLGGLAMYVWTSIAHVATPLGETGFSTLPNEATTMSALATSIGDGHGLYLFPARMSGKSAGPNEGPLGFLVYRPHVVYSLNPSNLAVEFVTELVEAIIAALLLSFAALSGYLSRVGFVTLVGITAAISTNISYWNWYGFPTTFTLATCFIELIGFLAAGLVIAWLLPARKSA
jgi:hypothetical protein